MYHPTDRIIHTTAFVTPVVEHWLERDEKLDVAQQCSVCLTGHWSGINPCCPHFRRIFFNLFEITLKHIIVLNTHSWSWKSHLRVTCQFYASILVSNNIPNNWHTEVFKSKGHVGDFKKFYGRLM